MFLNKKLTYSLFFVLDSETDDKNAWKDVLFFMLNINWF